jgi:2-polyprenyl-3-methyl-5-hydroxy-6-metoxy-1,4-benzoquinol methylase
MAEPVTGTEGYTEAAERLFERDADLPFAEVHRVVLHLIPQPGARILDIGAGTGRDAAVFAAMGHSVVAVEPTDALRTRAMAVRASPRIEWLNDALPALSLLRQRGETFDAVMLTAVWMHLDAKQRRDGMPVVASLVRDGGVAIMSLRHGPVPPRRRMFEVSAEETIALAQPYGLHPILKTRTESIQLLNRQAGVSWTRLAFRKLAQNATYRDWPEPDSG